MLYVGGDGGVFRSEDGGTTWTVYPAVTYTWTLASALTAGAATLTVNAGGPTAPTTPFTITIGAEELEVTATSGNVWTILRGQDGTGAAAHAAGAVATNNGDNAVQQGGLLPDLDVTSLQLMTGNINTSTGLPNASTGFNMLLASTYGQGDFAIRLDNSAVTPFATPAAVFNFPISGPGSGIYVYRPGTGFQQILTTNASLLALNTTANTNGDVAAELPGGGVSRYTAVHAKLEPVDAVQRHAAGDRRGRRRVRRVRRAPASSSSWPAAARRP